jgi:AraC-like DNA-binding protein
MLSTVRQDANKMSSANNDFRPVALRIDANDPDEMLHAQDYWNVNLGEAWEVSFWAREFGCSEEELRHAVEHAGSRAGDVRAHLEVSRQRSRS